MTKNELEQVKKFMQLSNYAEGTIEKYLSCLKRYATLDDYLEYLIKLKPSTRQVYLSALKIYLKVSNQEHLINKLPKVKQVENFRDYKPIPLETFANLHYDDIFHKLVVVFLAFTGLRRGEVLKLKWSDIDLDEGFMLVERKGRKKQKLPIHPKLIPMLRAWRRVNHDERVFPVSATTIWRIVKRYTDKYPHYLRGVFASVMGQRNLPATQILLGHKNIRTTMRYVRPDYSSLVEVLRNE